MTVRRLRPEDLPAVAAIQAASPRAGQWPPDQYLRHRCTVLLDGPEVIGFLVVRDTVPGRERELLNLAVHPANRRKGGATLLLQHELSGQSGSLYLEVRASNREARTLYRRLGFEECGTRPGYYNDPPDNGIVMRL